ncbi:phosphoribosyltransferase-like protein [Xanthomonas campestris]|uniref:phosphoribosyltransferase-like protein n=1 Tax=Xanthomonas campestris TaxID=339 RepID=UPI002379FE96|nr:hypothetical protein [Xanthomonas campestris]WDL55842.1 hypothetical protein JH263_07705 [Xanthomonas campestris pv. campestris]
MAGNAQFIDAESTSGWLAQFLPEEQITLVKMLRRMLLISSDEFSQGIHKLTLARLAALPGVSPIGLYAEREVRKNSKTKMALPLFKQTRDKVRSATSTFRAIDPVLTWVPEVGSEGIIAQLVTELCRVEPKLLNHPNPRQIRSKQMRRFIVLTDFIGSGQRMEHFLNAAWATWSVRSWHSSRARKGITFEVIAYSATEAGKQRIEAHKCSPKISLVTPCPTIGSSFSKDEADEIRQLCIHRDPGDHDAVESLGYGGTGGLIAFAHGAPNNVPRILTEPSKRKPIQIPLFPKRVTAATRSTFSSILATKADIDEALTKIGRERLAQLGFASGLPLQTAKRLLVLAALTSRQRQIEVIAGRTNLTIPEVESAIDALSTLKWITPQRRLTDEGQRELRKHRPSKQKPAIPLEPQSDYYPKQLRAPV